MRNNASVSFDEMVDIKLNTGMEAADRFLDDLLNAVSEYRDSLTLKAAEVLLKMGQESRNRQQRGSALFNMVEQPDGRYVSDPVGP